MGLCGMPAFGIGDVVGVVLVLAAISATASHQDNYLCPKKFVPIGKKCYFFSKDEAIWHDAHFKCSGLNSSLAVITKPHQELVVRRYLNRRSEGRYERWLGGRYNEKQSKWVWGASGKPLTFHGFSRMNYNDGKWAWHCIIVDPARQNKWNAKNCVDKRRYICQRHGRKIKNFDPNKCGTSEYSTIYKELCSKRSVGNTAPGFLVKKPKKPNNPYNVATFVCPSHMILVGRKCYFFSTEQLQWSDAYWACRDNKSKLAVLTTRMQDSILRGFLKANFTEKHERWIGGIFDWKQNKWKWAMSGKVIRYKHFAKSVLLENKNNTQHCITLDPLYDHLWNSKNRMERKHYICQAKAKSVVKYVKPTQSLTTSRPDATVLIKFENTSIVEPTSPSHQFSYNNAATDKYVYN